MMKRKRRMEESERLRMHGEISQAITALHVESVDAATWFIGGNSTVDELIKVLQKESAALAERKEKGKF